MNDLDYLRITLDLDSEDLPDAVRSFVYEEDLSVVSTTLRGLKAQGCSDVALFNLNGTSSVLPWHYFESMYLKADEGIDEDAPVENGSFDIFELTSEQERTHLAQWAEAVLPGVDLVKLQERAHPGDLVLHRPGGAGFEVYSRSENASFEDKQLRLSCAQLAVGTGPTSKVRLDTAKEIYAWITGAES